MRRAGPGEATIIQGGPGSATFGRVASVRVAKVQGFGVQGHIEAVANHCGKFIHKAKSAGAAEPHATWRTTRYHFRITLRSDRPGIYVLTAHTAEGHWRPEMEWQPVGAWDSTIKAVEAAVEYEANGGCL